MHISTHPKGAALEDALWQTALETAGSIQLSTACEQSLRGWIAIGIQRMERQQRMAADDLALAHTNLRKFVDLLKKEAIFQGKPNRIDSETFRATRIRLRRRASMTTFTLWPFWPHNFVLAA